MIHEVILVPGMPSQDREDEPFRRIDMIDRYAWAVAEQLEQDNIRYRVVNMLKAKGKVLPNGHVGINSLFICLDLSSETLRTKNKSKVFYSNSLSKRLASYLTDGLSDWGSAIAFGHQAANPAPAESWHVLPADAVMALRVEPFSHLGPSVQAYIAKLPALGRDLGRAIADYLKTKEWALRNHTTSKMNAPSFAATFASKTIAADDSEVKPPLELAGLLKLR